MSDKTICGLTYEAHPPRVSQYAANRRISFHGGHHLPKRDPITKYTVEGIKHPKGAPIRFKSLDGAERHIRNMGLARD